MSDFCPPFSTSYVRAGCQQTASLISFFVADVRLVGRYRPLPFAHSAAADGHGTEATNHDPGRPSNAID